MLEGLDFISSISLDALHKREDTTEENKELALFKFFQNYVNILEGIKTQIKNIHWASLKLPNRDKRGAHLYLDELIEEIDKFQDLVAESAMGITNVSFEFNSVYGVSFQASSTSELMKYMQDETLKFYDSIPDKSICSGIKSETEVFILRINQFIYRFKLTE